MDESSALEEARESDDIEQLDAEADAPLLGTNSPSSSPTNRGTAAPGRPRSRRPHHRRRPRPKWRIRRCCCGWWPLVRVPRFVIVVVAVCWTLFFVTWGLPRLLNPTPPSPAERQRDQEWVSSSPYWLDRTACRWLSLCGLHHLRWDAPALNVAKSAGEAASSGGRRKTGEQRRFEPRRRRDAEAWETAPAVPAISRVGGQGAMARRPVPDYVLRFAPLVHLYSGENFWPSHVSVHVAHMRPFVDGVELTRGGANRSLADGPERLGLADLDDLNSAAGEVHLRSVVDVEKRPEWLHSHAGIPSVEQRLGGTEDAWKAWEDAMEKEGSLASSGSAPHMSRHAGRRGVPASVEAEFRAQLQDRENKPDAATGRSTSPAILVMVDKGQGIVDAFWFFFYSYNLGQTVLGVRFGNHVGDWEHCMVRFENGVPRAMFLSEHAGGLAYEWAALEKKNVTSAATTTTSASGAEEDKEASVDERPVIYSAVGSHAMYATPGDHPYVLPFGMLKDVTDKGPLWDPARNAWAYWHDPSRGADDESGGGFGPAASTARSDELPPTGWLRFSGTWGDALYALADGRQWRLFGQLHYVTGPRGPRDKSLGRETMCPPRKGRKCRIMRSLEDGRKGRWYS